MKRLVLVAVSLAILATAGAFAADVSKPVPTPGKMYWDAGAWNTVADYQKATGKQIAKFSEAPMLADMVKAGKLPSVDKRLPAEPQVQDVCEEIGQYGGDWHQVWRSVNEVWPFDRITMEGLLQFKWDGSKVVPNLATKFDVSSDASLFTFYLRKGVKWSDGQPFTADDIVFLLNEVYANSTLYPAYPSWLQVNGKPVVAQKVDDYTVRLKFAGSYGLFPSYVANNNFMGTPKHYVKQFMPPYTSTADLSKAAKDAGYADWAARFQAMCGYNALDTNPDLPTLRAWAIETQPSTTRTVFERNPYYWKVDPVGNQLPYIDRMVWDQVPDIDTWSLKVIAGEIDCQSWGLGTDLAKYTLLKQNEQKGDYRVLEYSLADGAKMIFIPNYDTKDPQLYKLFMDKRFRIALSYAIDRNEMNELLYSGLGQPWQAALVPGVPYYSEKWGKAYIDYDTAKANQLLDEIGLTKRDANGYRLRLDGKPLELVIETRVGDVEVKPCELVADYWKKVGINSSVKSEERSLYTDRDMAGLPIIKTWGNFDRQLPTFLVDAIRYVPMSFGTETWRQWGLWYESNHKQGSEPPQEIKDLQNWYDIARTTPSDAVRDQYAKKIVDQWANNIYLIGTVARTPFIEVAKNNFRNVPEQFVSDWMPRWDHACQFFIKQ